MLTDERKAIVDALTDDELAYEVNRGRTSRFQGDLYNYARTIWEGRQRAKQEQRESDHLTVAKESRDATRWGAHGTWIAIVVTLILVLVAKLWG